jgi:hypothetical protein
VTSDAVALLGAPFRRYAALAAEGDAAHARALPRRLAAVLGAVGCFVSITTAGRLTLVHVAWAMLAWSFLPALQAVALAVALRGVAPGRARAAAFSLLLLGTAPWITLLLALAGVCLLAPDVAAALGALLRVGALPLAVIGAVGWSALLTVALLRAGLGLTRAATARCALRYYGLLAALIAGWYVAAGELLPLLGVFP